MGELVFRVRRVAGGWVVDGAQPIGGVTDRASAVDLAAGIVTAIRRARGEARLIVEDPDDAGADAGF